jgi:hypothetical protein
MRCRCAELFVNVHDIGSNVGENLFLPGHVVPRPLPFREFQGFF